MISVLVLVGHLALPGTMSLPSAHADVAPHTVLARISCKQVGSCEEAVAIWCGGYARADGDSDGIPCENVCHSLEQVETIKARQGC
jgi:hypothetical protein